jgi:hypothetical protein
VRLFRVHIDLLCFSLSHNEIRLRNERNCTSFGAERTPPRLSLSSRQAYKGPRTISSITSRNPFRGLVVHSVAYLIYSIPKRCRTITKIPTSPDHRTLTSTSLLWRARLDVAVPHNQMATITLNFPRKASVLLNFREKRPRREGTTLYCSVWLSCWGGTSRFGKIRASSRWKNWRPIML